ncbi:MAG: WG repeat-containing protein [Saprospiraceae bacterium]|nr:WG repeat-containing protein [Saprospiraceae bacterium]
MYYKIVIIFLLSFFFHLDIIGQEDTSTYKKRYAFLVKPQENNYEKGQVFFLMDNLYKVWQDNSFMWGFYNMDNNETLSTPKYDTIIYRYLYKQKKGFYQIKENGKWGLLNSNRSDWVPVKYDQLNYISKRNEHYISVKSEDKYGVLNADGHVILDTEYDEIGFDGYRYKVSKGNKWGLMDINGKELIPICFDKIIHHEYISHTNLKLGDKWSVHNWIKDKPCTFNKNYNSIDYFSDYFIARDNDKFGLLDINAKELLPFDYDFMSPFFLRYLNAILVGKDKKVGILRIDSSGNVLTSVPIQYSDVWVEEHTLKIKVRLKDKIDYFFNDQTLFDLRYNDVKYYPNINRVMVKEGNKWGMLTIDGEQIIPIVYNKIHVMNLTQLMVQKGNKWGLMDIKGNVMIPLLYDEFDYRPKKNFFFVKKGNKWGIVSPEKGVILSPDYDDMVTLPNRTFLVKQRGLWGVVAAGGRILLPIEYSSYDYKYKAKQVFLKHSSGVVKKYPLF